MDWHKLWEIVLIFLFIMSLWFLVHDLALVFAILILVIAVLAILRWLGVL